MSIHVALNHVTHYQYERSIQLGPQVVRLRPAPHSRTRILSYSLRVEPANHFINWQQDPLSNHLARLVFPDKTSVFRIEVDLVAEMSVLNPFDFFLEPSAEEFPFSYDETLQQELAPYLVKQALTPSFANYLQGLPRTPMRTNDFVVAVNQRLQGHIRYLIRMEPGVQSPEQTLTLGCGSCRDSAWLLVQLLRHLGLAARFVSGYLIQLKSDVKALDGPSGPEQDFTDLHAWCEVFLPGAGWIGLDPTSGLLAGEGHVPLACSPEPSSAAPITGVLEHCNTTLEHHMKVTRVWEAPRVTLPYSDAQWSAIDEIGRQVDRDLQNHDVRLTQGGEPTFVSVDDREGAEWNTAALGPKKRLLSVSLMERLRAQYGEGGLLHHGQGKWYPGEQLPRWSLNLYWRNDGEPVWTRPKLLADEHAQHGATEQHAQTFLKGVAQRLKVDPRHVFAAFEDAWYYLWKEHKLPINVDPFDARLSEPLERDRLRKVFDQGLAKVVGHVLPVMQPPQSKRWVSGPWFLRGERCHLVPGDSPLGYRLPLESQPWVSDSDRPWIHPPDQSQDHPPLPEHAGLGADAGSSEHPAANAALVPPVAFQSAADVVRTAMAAEPREGRLCIFMPPASTLEGYLELVAAVESTAAEMQLPVVLEGYEPPKDPRLTVLRVTPDPGVIEVNVHPAHSWPELVGQTTHLYDAAFQTRLSTEKFMLDGRHTGTGGGNHFVLGGATVADSPFLRRPDLLASMIAYWHNHPALSYLFSGLFVGPTSQAPRVDEARNDSVYELEIAFAELRRLSRERPQGRAAPSPPPEGGEKTWGGPAFSDEYPQGRAAPSPPPEGGEKTWGGPAFSHENDGESPPWLVDRLLRNLLIDSTGNTHRAEFCIDKLYSPDGPTGRLGLLEMRAFEMPPHARMSLTQQLLMRALVSRFWQTPYQPERLQRWGTELHDRFMLPHFLSQDLDDVLEELRAFGYNFQADWFAPHFNFRFPRLGDFQALGVAVELRMALEPWHVMGEEGVPGGATRFVDASLERIQVKVTGAVGERHVLTCNGRAVPLQPTGATGEFIGAVRYRAWNPPSALHPTIDVQAPLTFDLVDTWMNRSMGGCQYHVAHPGGRNYETFPVNAFEAEARRLGRFFREGHTPGTLKVAPEKRNPYFPFTLDLRWSPP